MIDVIDKVIGNYPSDPPREILLKWLRDNLPVAVRKATADGVGDCKLQAQLIQIDRVVVTIYKDLPNSIDEVSIVVVDDSAAEVRGFGKIDKVSYRLEDGEPIFTDESGSRLQGRVLLDHFCQGAAHEYEIFPFRP